MSWVHWVLEPSLRSLAGFIESNKKLAELHFFKKYISMLGKILHKGEIFWQKPMNNKLQNFYQTVKVLETSMFVYIFEYREQSTVLTC